MDERTTHKTVLLTEAIDGLALSSADTVIDATLGAGGHAARILEKLGHEGTFLGTDADLHAIERFRAQQMQCEAQVRLAVGNFRDIAAIAQKEGIESADAILADLGWRTGQFLGSTEAGGGKGFSFTADEPLAMTYGDPDTYPFVAADIVNEWEADDITNVLKAYGEERYARSIARRIVQERERAPIETAAQLADIVAAAVPARYRRGKIHPATKTFQALRIAVNDEFDALTEFIEGAMELLAPGGRLAIITFHSIEDRIVKHTFRALESEGRALRIAKRPVMPQMEECTANPRARSAKLRIIEKTKAIYDTQEHNSILS